MAYRNLMIESPANMKLCQKQLIIFTDKEHSIPLEDISSILIENRQATITMATLSSLAENNVTVFICNEKHLPCAVMIPFAQHSRTSLMLKYQEKLSQPLRKQLWQQIVKSKINNQANCLELLGKNNAEKYLRNLIKNVLSGDSTNVEAIAARYYFQQAFSNDFIRENDYDVRNHFLNYGYSILRGHIARLIATYGFVPMLGLHHKSELNSYNLADDFFEPFRPIVDLYVAQMQQPIELSPLYKRELFNLLNMDIYINNQYHSVSYAAELMIQSFSRCCQNKSKELSLHKLVELRQHKYE